MTIFRYICEEVSRQGHPGDNGRILGMNYAWEYAIDRADKIVTKERILTLGKFIEPDKNGNGFRTVNVYMGNKTGAPVDEINTRLDKILSMQDNMIPLEFYIEFETIHPFLDGNGRVGKILLNWKNGTLGNPIFPPNNIFGEPIVNP